MTFCNFNEIVMETILYIYVHVCKLCIRNHPFKHNRCLPQILQTSLTCWSTYHDTINRLISYGDEECGSISENQAKMSSGGSHDDDMI